MAHENLHLVRDENQLPDQFFFTQTPALNYQGIYDAADQIAQLDPGLALNGNRYYSAQMLVNLVANHNLRAPAYQTPFLSLFATDIDANAWASKHDAIGDSGIVAVDAKSLFATGAMLFNVESIIGRGFQDLPMNLDRKISHVLFQMIPPEVLYDFGTFLYGHPQRMCFMYRSILDQEGPHREGFLPLHPGQRYRVPALENAPLIPHQEAPLAYDQPNAYPNLVPMQPNLEAIQAHPPIINNVVINNNLPNNLPDNVDINDISAMNQWRAKTNKRNSRAKIGERHKYDHRAFQDNEGAWKKWCTRELKDQPLDQFGKQRNGSFYADCEFCMSRGQYQRDKQQNGQWGGKH